MERKISSAWLFGYCDKLKTMVTMPSRLFKEAKEGVEDAQFIVTVMEHYLLTVGDMPNQKEVPSLPPEMVENFLMLVSPSIQSKMESEKPVQSHATHCFENGFPVFGMLVVGILRDDSTVRGIGGIL